MDRKVGRIGRKWLEEFLLGDQLEMEIEEPIIAQISEIQLLPSKGNNYAAFATVSDGHLHIKTIFSPESIQGMFAKRSFLDLKGLNVALKRYSFWPFLDGNLSQCELQLVVDAFDWPKKVIRAGNLKTTNILEHEPVLKKLRILWRKKRIKKLASIDVRESNKLALICCQRMISKEQEKLLNRLPDWNGNCHQRYATVASSTNMSSNYPSFVRSRDHENAVLVERNNLVPVPSTSALSKKRHNNDELDRFHPKKRIKPNLGRAEIKTQADFEFHYIEPSQDFMVNDPHSSHVMSNEKSVKKNSRCTSASSGRKGYVAIYNVSNSDTNLPFNEPDIRLNHTQSQTRLTSSESYIGASQLSQNTPYLSQFTGFLMDSSTQMENNNIKDTENILDEQPHCIAVNLKSAVRIERQHSSTGEQASFASHSKDLTSAKKRTAGNDISQHRPASKIAENANHQVIYKENRSNGISNESLAKAISKESRQNVRSEGKRSEFTSKKRLSKCISEKNGSKVIAGDDSSSFGTKKKDDNINQNDIQSSWTLNSISADDVAGISGVNLQSSNGEGKEIDTEESQSILLTSSRDIYGGQHSLMQMSSFSLRSKSVNDASNIISDDFCRVTPPRLQNQPHVRHNNNKKVTSIEVLNDPGQSADYFLSKKLYDRSQSECSIKVPPIFMEVTINEEVLEKLNVKEKRANDKKASGFDGKEPQLRDHDMCHVLTEMCRPIAGLNNKKESLQRGKTHAEKNAHYNLRASSRPTTRLQPGDGQQQRKNGTAAGRSGNNKAQQCTTETKQTRKVATEVLHRSVMSFWLKEKANKPLDHPIIIQVKASKS